MPEKEGVCISNDSNYLFSYILLTRLLVSMAAVENLEGTTDSESSSIISLAT